MEYFSLPSNEKELEEICNQAKDWALMHGLVMKSKSNYTEDSVVMAPFTLVPSAFKRDSFHEVVKIQTAVNELLHKVAHDYQFLKESLESVLDGDDFTRRLFKIYDTVRNEGFKQSISLGILRTDYLPHYDMALKQVEMNTVSCSLSSLAYSVSHLHRYIISELGQEDLLKNLPENNALQGVSTGIFKGWQHFGNSESCILFLVENVTRNIADQRFIEYEVRKIPGAPKVLRRTLKDISDRGKLDDKFNLCLDGYIVGLFYFRVGYDPTHYETEADWDARLMIERSTAIKCPNIQMHLAGTKKVQQKLAEPGVLERFGCDKSILKTFVSIYSLDSSDSGKEALKLALADPEKYVVKPQREGGGHNIYGADVATALSKMTESERASHILMERILPPPASNVLVRLNLPPVNVEVISELGIFGVIIGYPDNILYNKQAGHMLRTKLASVDEGGVAAGYGALDSPYLV